MATDSASERSLSPDGAANHHDSDQQITLRFIANMKEAGGIIGKGGDNVKRFREESGARINISDASSSERIVVVMGTAPQVKVAFRLIGQKFEEDLQSAGQEGAHITFRLIIPNTNCGSLIGKSGANIKELRELTGATIQVANEMLPNSTERNVTLSGSIDAIMKALDKVCAITVETKPKGPSIPYQPARGGFGGGPSQRGYGGGMGPMYHGLRDGSYGGYDTNYGGYGSRGGNRMSGGRGGQYSLMGEGPAMYGRGGGGGMRGGYLGGVDYSDTMGLLGGGGGFQAGGGGGRTITREISVAGPMVGYVIGRQGARINEIRQNSQASVKIVEVEEGSMDRKIVISGTPYSVSSAAHLISNILARYKAPPKE